MATLALLLAALACLAVGLVLSSTLWLTLSLIASGLAALSLYRWRLLGTLRSRRGPAGQQAPAVASPTPAQVREPSGSGPDDGPDSSDGDVWVIDGRPRYHRRGCEFLRGQDAESIPPAQAVEDGFIPCSLCEPDVAAHRS